MISFTAPSASSITRRATQCFATGEKTKENMTPSKPLRVVIIGAGIGGLTCAIACRRERLEVVVVEQAPELLPVGAGIQIPPNASRIMARFGLLEDLMEKGNILEAIQLRHYRDGTILTSRPAGATVVEEYGSPWLLIHRSDYHKVLCNEAIRLGTEILLDAKVARVNFEESQVVLERGDILEGDVIIGGDGLWSSTRDQLLGYPSPPSETNDLAYRGTFSRKQLLALNDRRVEQLCDRSMVTTWIGPDRHTVFYPVKSGEQFNLVLVRPDNLPVGVRTVVSDINEMKDSYMGWDEVLTKMISCVPSALKWKLCHHEELDTWTKGHVALLGDACHPTLPYQAQGAAMAVEDGAVIGRLLGLLDRAIPGHAAQCVPDMLQLYEGLQKSRSTTNVQGAIANQRLFHMPEGPEMVARDEALKEADYKSPSTLSWADASYQKSLLGSDCVQLAEDGFNKWWQQKQLVLDTQRTSLL